MQSGTVKWFNDAKGFGFISADEKDVFVHYSQVERNEEGYRTLYQGDAVSFVLADGPRGLYAVNVQKVQP